MRRLATAVVVVATAGALGGCSLAGEQIAEPTSTELAAMTAQVNDIQWQNLQFSPDSPRPTVEFSRFIEPDQTDAVYTACMEEAGYIGWEQVIFNSLGGPPAAERLDLYECVSRFPVHPAYYGIHTTAQLDAIYDFYRDSLVPCLRGAGLEITGVPTRDEFVKSEFLYTWSPYAQNFDIPDTVLSGVYEQCPDFSYVIGLPVE